MHGQTLSCSTGRHCPDTGSRRGNKPGQEAAAPGNCGRASLPDSRHDVLREGAGCWEWSCSGWLAREKPGVVACMASAHAWTPDFGNAAFDVKEKEAHTVETECRKYIGIFSLGNHSASKQSSIYHILGDNESTWNIWRNNFSRSSNK